MTEPPPAAPVTLPRRREPVHRPGVLAVVVGVVRMLGLVVLAAVGAVVALVAALVPVRIRGIRPAQAVCVGLARAFLALMGTRVVCADPEAIRRHRGLVFFNHLSYLEPVALVALGPARPLATSNVRKIPFIGAIAIALGTVFVDRSDKASRRASRAALLGRLQERPWPPVILSPEGGIGPGPGVVPFRHGAFEIAIEGGFSIRPVVVRYEPPGPEIWLSEEWVLRAAWRLAARTHPFTITLTPLPLVVPQAAGTEEEEDAQAEALARALEVAYNRELIGRAVPGDPSGLLVTRA